MSKSKIRVVAKYFNKHYQEKVKALNYRQLSADIIMKNDKVKTSFVTYTRGAEGPG